MTTDNNHIDENMLLDDERIANYLKGKMTAEEEQAFLDAMRGPETPQLSAEDRKEVDFLKKNKRRK